MPVDELRRDLGFPDSAFARDDLDHGALPLSPDEVGPEQIQFGGSPGEVGIARRNLVRPDPQGRRGRSVDGIRDRRDGLRFGRDRCGHAFVSLSCLPEDPDLRHISLQRLDDQLQEMPARYVRAAEHVVNGRPADLTLPSQGPDLCLDLTHGRKASFHVKLMEAVEEISDRPGRSRVPPYSCHCSILQDFGVSKFVKACTSSQRLAAAYPAIRGVRESVKASMRVKPRPR